MAEARRRSCEGRADGVCMVCVRALCVGVGVGEGGGQLCGRDGGGLWFKGASFDRFNLGKGNILPRNVCLLAK